MKTPTPKKTASGWRIQLRLGGQSVIIKDLDKKQCVKKAEAAKAQYRLDGLIERDRRADPTLREAIEAYIGDRDNALSPATIRKYENIRTNHWKGLMELKVSQTPSLLFQREANDMLGRYAQKTVSVSWGMIKTVYAAQGVKVPKVSLGKHFETDDAPKFLEPDQIHAFVKVAQGSPYSIPLLLALSSMRIAEIDGLDWSQIRKDHARVVQVRVLDKDGSWVIKRGAKNETSVRNVEFMIPELQAAIDRERKPAGKVLTSCQETLRRECKRVCAAAGVPEITVHGLRHSFASLTAHLGISESVSQEIGGWANDKIMKEIYTHVASMDLERGRKLLRDFYKAPERKRPKRVTKKLVRIA